MKKTIALLLVALSLFCTSCNEVKNGETAVTPNPTIEAQEATPEEVVETYFEAWSEKSFEGMQSQVCMKLDELLLNFDIQKIKRYYEAGIDSDNVAILGAFELYLDFINIFIHLLQLIGDAKD